VALDLKGDYAAAREHLKKAIEVAPVDRKNRALRLMAFSYAFESNADEAEKYEKQVFDAQPRARPHQCIRATGGEEETGRRLVGLGKPSDESEFRLSSQRNRRNILSDQFTTPRIAGLAFLISISEVVPVEGGAQISWRRFREWIVEHETFHFRRAFQQSPHELKNPTIAAVVAEGGKPHLPVQAGLMWGNPEWPAIHLPRLVLELIRQPGFSVVRAFDADFGTSGRHDCE
jgi:tetratricopeptide (TPR) repeat protein